MKGYRNISNRRPPRKPREYSKAATWEDFEKRRVNAPTPDGEPHFQHYQFDPSLSRAGVNDRFPAIGEAARAVIWGDRSLSSKIGHLLDTPCGVLTEAAFRVP